ncbi:hypothetical protein, variant [Sphaeroforma arctica JP610]|uniref:L-type lectin-like domain-containing protein n=1 Tax=Sphaeroforma arctica JP610 TaxID=667725 RepID=A0A0L0FQM3_9EUKA|nr:hypothetical protein, variant [Sphaeroforma arctica JP610]KNC79014.1 hypothetical protein, variant [Sphaeroforma arctica JP610]|eukprot:XP_014152916.1 hypothetical protein, variant [Sphaeroforma arctica JP610]
MVTKEKIRLTKDAPSKSGMLWNTAGLESANWIIEFEFAVDGESSRLYGDGFVFWLTKDFAKEGNVFGAADKFTGLAIFFDTYNNHQGEHNHAHPYISAMMNDGSKSYDHDADGTHTEMAGCQANFRAKKHPTRARLSYLDHTLSLDLDYLGRNEYQRCFSEPQVQIPTGYHIGFSAVTGALHDNHDILSVITKIISVTNPPRQDDIADRHNVKPATARTIEDRPHVASKPVQSTTSKVMWTGFEIVFILVIGLSVLGGLIYYARMKNNEKMMKRF